MDGASKMRGSHSMWGSSTDTYTHFFFFFKQLFYFNRDKSLHIFVQQTKTILRMLLCRVTQSDIIIPEREGCQRLT